MAVIWPFPTLENLSDDMHRKISRMQRECNAYAQGHSGLKRDERIRERWHDDREITQKRNQAYNMNSR